MFSRHVPKNTITIALFWHLHHHETPPKHTHTHALARENVVDASAIPQPHIHMPRRVQIKTDTRSGAQCLVGYKRSTTNEHVELPKQDQRSELAWGLLHYEFADILVSRSVLEFPLRICKIPAQMIFTYAHGCCVLTSPPHRCQESRSRASGMLTNRSRHKHNYEFD